MAKQDPAHLVPGRDEAAFVNGCGTSCDFALTEDQRVDAEKALQGQGMREQC